MFTRTSTNNQIAVLIMIYMIHECHKHIYAHVNESCLFSQSFENDFENHGLVTKIIMQVYLYLYAIGMLLLGGALACYGEQPLFYFSILSFSRFEFNSFLLLKWMYCFVCLVCGNASVLSNARTRERNCTKGMKLMTSINHFNLNFTKIRILH